MVGTKTQQIGRAADLIRSRLRSERELVAKIRQYERTGNTDVGGYSEAQQDYNATRREVDRAIHQMERLAQLPDA